MGRSPESVSASLSPAVVNDSASPRFLNDISDGYYCACWPTFSKVDKTHSQRTNLLFSRKPVGLGFYKPGCPWLGAEDSPALSSQFSCRLPLVWDVPMVTTFLRVFGTVLLCPFVSFIELRVRARKGLRFCLTNPP